MANLLLRHLKHMFGWCLERGLIEASPVAGIRAPAEMRSRDRVLTDAELAAAWRACDALGWPFGPLVRLLILTGQRRDEVAGMRWWDLYLERQAWELPRELTKSDRAHVVPLSDPALEIIAALPQLGELVFPARRASGTNAVSGFSRAKARLDAEMLVLLRQQAAGAGDDVEKVELKPWRLHRPAADRGERHGQAGGAAARDRARP